MCFFGLRGWSGKGQILRAIKLRVATLGHMVLTVVLTHHVYPSRFHCAFTGARPNATVGGAWCVSCAKQRTLFGSRKGMDHSKGYRVHSHSNGDKRQSASYSVASCTRRQSLFSSQQG
jgi:hypothetical protein